MSGHLIRRLGSHAAMGVESACSKAISSASHQLPLHIKQEKPTWKVIGSGEAGVLNNNCVLTSMKNLFFLFGWEREVPYLKSAILTMHENIIRHRGKTLEMDSVMEALRNLPEKRKRDICRGIQSGQIDNLLVSKVPLTVFQEIFTNDARALIKHGYSQHNIQGLMQDIQHLPQPIRQKVEAAIEQRTITEEFIQGIVAQVKAAEGKLTSQSISRNSAIVFMAQLGMKPEEIALGSPMARQMLLKALLEEGKPICLAERNLPVLASIVEGSPKNVIGHFYMVFKKNGKLFVSEPGKSQLIELPERILREKLEDPRLLGNSEAIIIHNPPDPLRWLRAIQGSRPSL